MKKNFLLDKAVGIYCEGHYFDLHNFYDFQGINFYVSEKICHLNFISSSNFKELKKNLSIKFYGIDFFEFSKNFFICINHNLSEIGYKSREDRCHDWILGEDQFSPDKHLFFRFYKDQYIRIHARLASVEYQ